MAIAQLYRQNLQMLLDLGRINTTLEAAQSVAAKGDAAGAIAQVDGALDIAESIRRVRNQAFADAVAEYYKTWRPRVAEANGREFLDKVDDVKDHLPVRTVDMTYLIYRQPTHPPDVGSMIPLPEGHSGPSGRESTRDEGLKRFRCLFSGSLALVPFFLT
jgi:hypothetical protein